MAFPLKRIGLFLVKLFVMLIVTVMIMVLIPEFRYDLGPKTPVDVAAPKDLSPQRFATSTFATVHGKGDFKKAFIHSKYGVPYTYFLLEGYGPALVVRTAEKVDDDWEKLDRHVGRLRTYRRMPFSRTVRAVFKDRFKVDIPADALFLARDDVPRLSGWQVAAAIFASTLWLILTYIFFVHGFVRRRKAKASPAEPRPDAG
ncbi:MAG: hypothetical protein QGG42_08900 [Phycisphaerae bacterium]|jgi:hypothetical protein|nr:hypothetical protein [Phycisphaerae bacterium]